MNTYTQLEAEMEQAELSADYSRTTDELLGPLAGNCREVVAAYLLTRSELMRNGAMKSDETVTSADAVALAKIALSMSWGWPRRERPFPAD